MPKAPYCVHHFQYVVTSSAGRPTCRGCGCLPTPDEEASGIEALVRWEEAKARGTLHPPRKSR